MAGDLHRHDRCDRNGAFGDHRQCRCAERHGRLRRRPGSSTVDGDGFHRHDDRRAAIERVYHCRVRSAVRIFDADHRLHHRDDDRGYQYEHNHAGHRADDPGRLRGCDSAARSGHGFRRVQAGPTRHGDGYIRDGHYVGARSRSRGRRHRHRPPELAPYFFDPAATLFDRLCSWQLFHAREA